MVQNDAHAERIEKQWSVREIPVPLEVVRTDAGAFTAATIGYVDELARSSENTMVNVVIPEFYVEHWWQHVLHNPSTLVLKGRLLFRKTAAVTSIPYRVEIPAPARA